LEHAPHNWNVLVVEDDPDGQTVVQLILEYLTAQVDVAEDADQAAKLLFQSNRVYTAAIIDLALPGKDGWALLGEIRANPATAKLPCIAVTAFHTTKLREQVIKAGFDAYFPKPIDAILFTRQIEAVI
jgi:CheY-like chemotaxis protein